MIKKHKKNLELTENIHKKLFSASFLMILTRLLVKSIGLVSIVITARLLTPEDFGLIAIAMAIYAFIELFSSFGLATVLIQKSDADDDDYNTAWTFKALFGVISAALLIILSPHIAKYFEDLRLENLIYLISLTALLNGFSNIGVINFQKDLDFKKEMKYQVIPKFINFFVIVFLAYALKSYWALAIGIVFGNFISFLASYLMHPHRSKFGLKSAKKLMSFSKWLILNNALYYANEKLINLVIGKMLGTSAVGSYTMTNEISTIPSMEIAAPINKASFPVYSKLQSNLKELRVAYLSTLSLSSSITIPAAIGIALIAPKLISTALGNSWIHVIYLMQLLAVASLFSGLYSNISYVFNALGKPKIPFYFGVCKVISIYGLIYILVPFYGIDGVGYSLISTSIIMLIITKITLKKFINISFLNISTSLLRPVLSSLFMYIVAFNLLSFELSTPLLSLLTQIVISVISYLTFSFSIWHLQSKPDGLEEKITSLIRSKISKNLL
ncbi:MAG: lipopolysaccharide biosynthesis protein [Paraglaciecola sp.]|uniref:lipopolysaccharide biosynthesis protein n=1 Tax=Alteromonadaceae TaxID=72275 RepID=UPI00273FADEE|nr:MULTISPECIES: lipopolysaccharide biosynthesis protein [Alteromonadaceae]MDP5031308.1 lipopolysaccharide biosynthesis protein [Paraglaciecola sp.]MDP5133546.1 lipopolysaccharide biosynthesis protein [Paraglaciecola sp.]MDP5458158.1 lipopolysaccharide biosynthesis protein [Alishewanella sp. SMS8]